MIGEIFLPFNHPKSDVIQLSKVVNHLFKQTIAETQIKIHNIQPSTPPPRLGKGTQEKQTTNTVQSTLLRLRRQFENLNEVHFD